jgi:5-oxoprolinase (ATP-hydrolysing)
VATNALLERKGVPTALITTSGFRDILEIAHQSRPKIFELCVQKPELIYQAVIEVDERVRIVHKGSSRECVRWIEMRPTLNAAAVPHLKGIKTVVGSTGDTVEVLVEPKLDIVKAQLQVRECCVISHCYRHRRCWSMECDLLRLFFSTRMLTLNMSVVWVHW